MFEPDEFWKHDIEITPKVHTSITLEGWWGRVFRVIGNGEDNLWFLNRDKAMKEFWNRVDKAIAGE